MVIVGAFKRHSSLISGIFSEILFFSIRFQAATDSHTVCRLMCFYILHMHGLLDVIQIWSGSKSCYPRLSLKPASECAEFKTSGKIQEENFNCQQKNKKVYLF